MSDYEEEHFPIGMRTSFSSSFDAGWRNSPSHNSELTSIKRSRSGFCRGECITIDGENFTNDRNPRHAIKSAASPSNVVAETDMDNLCDENCVSDREDSVSRSMEHSPYHDRIEEKLSAKQSLKERCSPDNDSAAVIECTACVLSSFPSANGEHVNTSFDSCNFESSIDAAGSWSNVQIGDEQHLSSQLREKSPTPSSVAIQQQQRTVSDIRNNIPSIGNVRSCSEMINEPGHMSLPANLRYELTQLRKKSPGIAKRLEATTPSRCGEPGDFSVLDFNLCLDDLSSAVCDVSDGDEINVPGIPITTEDSSTTPSDSTPVAVCQKYTEQQAARKPQSNDAYFRFGDRYMSVDETRMWIWDSASEDANGATDPFCYSGVTPDAAVLDSCDDPEVERTFRMSPVLTECSSDDILEDEAMPVVEDGLSGSDTEDVIAARRCNNTRLHGASGSGGGDQLSESEVAEFFSGTVDQSVAVSSLCTGGDDDLKEDDDIVEKAIRDIRQAIEHSRGFRSSGPDTEFRRPSAAPSDSVEYKEDESVWVVRSGDASLMSSRPEGIRTTADGLNRKLAGPRQNANSDNQMLVEESVSVLEKTPGNSCSQHSPPIAVIDEACDSSSAPQPTDNLFRKCAAKLGLTRADYTTLPSDDHDLDHTRAITADNYRNGARKVGNGIAGQLGVYRSKPLGMGADDAYGRREDCGRDLAVCDLDGNEAMASGGGGATAAEHRCEVCMGNLDDPGNQNPLRKLSVSSTSEPEFLTEDGEYNTDDETDELLERQYTINESCANQLETDIEPSIAEEMPTQIKKSQPREALLPDADNRTVLIEGVLFRTRYLGSTKITSECNPSKARRMMQAQEAVGRIKTLGKLHFGAKYQLPDEDSQPSTEVDLFVSAEKIMVLDIGHREVIMDHALQTISYIADIGDLLVIMVRLAVKVLASPTSVANGNASYCDEEERRRRRVTICCHVFESDEAQLIAQSIGQAFQVAYAEFLKANGIEDPSLLKDVDYQEVLNQQQIFGEELALFSNNEKQKEVTVTKLKGESLGIVLVESGWGSMLPTVVLANLNPVGPAARSGRLNIGDQIMSIDGNSLVGLPLSVCQSYVKAARPHTVVRLKLVSCAPVVEVLIKRPHVKYQLGFSVQNGVICSLLRGGIGERGGVRVGHRIIEINGHSMVAVPHDRIVHLLATSVGEIHMKTMQTSVFRLLTGQDVPHYI